MVELSTLPHDFVVCGMREFLQQQDWVQYIPSLRETLTNGTAIVCNSQ